MCVTARIALLRAGYDTTASVLGMYPRDSKPRRQPSDALPVFPRAGRLLRGGAATARGAQESLLGSLPGDGHHPSEPYCRGDIGRLKGDTERAAWRYAHFHLFQLLSLF